MKEIYFIRHAKTEKIATAENLQIFCDEFGDEFLSGRGYKKANFGSDFVRNLNEIGREQAQILAKKFNQNGILPSIIIASSANRAMQTACIIAKGINLEHKILEFDELYEAGQGEMINFIKKISDKFERVFIVGHNPTIALTADFLCGNFEIEAFAPSSCLGVRFEIENFSQISQNSGKMVFYHNPKNL